MRLTKRFEDGGTMEAGQGPRWRALMRRLKAKAQARRDRRNPVPSETGDAVSTAADTAAETALASAEEPSHRLTKTSDVAQDPSESAVNLRLERGYDASERGKIEADLASSAEPGGPAPVERDASVLYPQFLEEYYATEEGALMKSDAEYLENTEGDKIWYGGDTGLTFDDAIKEGWKRYDASDTNDDDSGSSSGYGQGGGLGEGREDRSAVINQAIMERFYQYQEDFGEHSVEGKEDPLVKKRRLASMIDEGAKRWGTFTGPTSWRDL